MAFVDKLREEIITSQQAEGSLTRWKLLLIAAIGASSLGVLPNSSITERTMALLALLPLVCLYVDALCFHSGRRVMTIAKYFRNVDPALSSGAVDGEMRDVHLYELFCRNNRHHFGLEGIALLLVSVLLSTGVAVTGFGLSSGATWLPNPFPSGTGEDARWRLSILLIVSGVGGVIACTLLYVFHRRKVKELDKDPARRSFAVCIIGDLVPDGVQSRKLYEISRYDKASGQRQIEITNERGEKTLYAADNFTVVDIDVSRIK